MILHVVGIGLVLMLTIAFALALVDGRKTGTDAGTKKSVGGSPSSGDLNHDVEYQKEVQKKAGGVTSVSQYAQ